MRKQVVWKFHLQLTSDTQTIEAPIPAKVVHFDVQANRLTVWVLVEEGATTSSDSYGVFATGELAPPVDEASYIGTVQWEGYVWHLFKLMS